MNRRPPVSKTGTLTGLRYSPLFNESTSHSCIILRVGCFSNVHNGLFIGSMFTRSLKNRYDSMRSIRSRILAWRHFSQSKYGAFDLLSFRRNRLEIVRGILRGSFRIYIFSLMTQHRDISTKKFSTRDRIIKSIMTLAPV